MDPASRTGDVAPAGLAEQVFPPGAATGRKIATEDRQGRDGPQTGGSGAQGLGDGFGFGFGVRTYTAPKYLKPACPIDLVFVLRCYGSMGFEQVEQMLFLQLAPSARKYCAPKLQAR
jgi:hypothetical protein